MRLFRQYGAKPTSWDPHDEGPSPDFQPDLGHLGAGLGEESVLSTQPLPVALTIGAKEDEINRRLLGSKAGKGQAAPSLDRSFPRSSLLARVGAKGGVRPPNPQASGEEAPTAFGKWVIDSAMQEASEADCVQRCEQAGSKGGEQDDRFEFNSPTPLDIQSAVTVNQALSRAEPSLETVIAEQELPEGTGADFVPAPEGPQLG